MSWWRSLLGRSGTGVPVGDPVVAPARPTAGAAPSPVVWPDGPVPATELLGTTRSGRQVRGFRAPAGDLVGWWHRLRAEHATTGLWPVLLGPDVGDLSRSLVPEEAGDYDDAAELARATSSSPADLHAVRAERYARWGDPGVDPDPPGADEPRSLVPGEPQFTVAEQDGLVALVPAEHGWQVPVVLGWEGGVNVEMEPLDHAVVLRDWEARYGAELVGLSSDQVLELLVLRPPTRTAEALAVAREQYAYCPDVVDQGVGTLTALARDQVGSGSWYFWWD